MQLHFWNICIVLHIAHEVWDYADCNMPYEAQSESTHEARG